MCNQFREGPELTINIRLNFNMELISKLKKSNKTQVDKKLPPQLLESECKCALIALYSAKEE